MRFTTTPRYNKKAKKNFLKRALETMQMETFTLPREVCIEKLYSLKEYFNNVPQGTLSMEKEI